MALTTMEMIERAHTIDRAGADWWDVWTDTSITRAEAREIIMWADYETRRLWWQRRRTAQRRAMRLLRSMLSHEQKRQLRMGWSKGFRVTGSDGGVFKIYPHAPSGGQVRRVELHGQRWYEVAQYCFHTPKRDVPPADEALGFMLLLRASEMEFMLQANETIRPPIGWQRAIRWGRSSWQPSWLTRAEIKEKIAEMFDNHYAQRIAEAA